MMSIALVLLAATAPVEPDFTFREHNAVQSYSMGSLSKQMGCRDVDRARRCSSSDEVAGWAVDFGFSVVGGKLWQLDFSGHRNAIPDILASLKAKYGMPCRSGKDVIRNGVGASFQSMTFTWCFRTGEMVFRERDLQIDRFSVVYTDRVNAPPAERITPDF